MKRLTRKRFSVVRIRMANKNIILIITRGTRCSL
nr:MAG TPA: hypothetical protein [Caudoviricetes sp.]DAX60180.1 MAG TPA: hypothetical protein [Caudoviricetes sp.]